MVETAVSPHFKIISPLVYALIFSPLIKLPKLQPKEPAVEKTNFLNLPPLYIFKEFLREYPFIQPIAKELAALGELDHGMLVQAAGLNSCLKLFAEHNVIKEEFIGPLTEMILGGSLFHDIGKTAIVEEGIIFSLETMGENSIKQSSNNHHLDTRSLYTRALQNNHSGFSGYMTQKAVELGFFPVEVAPLIRQWAHIGFDHHSHDSWNKTPYPRDPRDRRNNRTSHNDRRYSPHPYENFASKLVQLSDVAVAMRSDRPNRQQPCDWPEIKEELKTYLSNETVLNFAPILNFKYSLGNNRSINLLRDLIIATVVDSVMFLDHDIRSGVTLSSQIDWLYEANGKGFRNSISPPLTDAEASKSCPILRTLAETVWKQYGGRFIKAVNRELKENNYVHLSRGTGR